MKELWNIQLSGCEIMACSGLFANCGKKLLYALYELDKTTTQSDGHGGQVYQNKLRVCFIDKQTGNTQKTTQHFVPQHKERTSHPDQLVTHNNAQYLYSAPLQGFVRLSSGKMVAAQLNVPLADRPKSPDARSYFFGGKTISLQSPFLLQCVDNKSKTQLWSLRLYNWLYTEIEERDGRIFFGTAGRGGSFYGVSLATGEVCCNIKTGGTVEYGWHNNHVYTFDTKGSLLQINPFLGQVVSRLRLTGKMELTRGMIVEGNRLYVAAWRRKDTSTHIVCVDLD